ncbi:MAG TPA: IS1595 family transposase [Actinomycetota bacterium]
MNAHGKGAMNLVKLIEQFGSEDKCREYLEDLRWPDGPACPRCESKSLSRVAARNQFDCNSCRYQFSVKVGTVFHDSHLPLWKWFLATYMMCKSKKGMSANQLKRTLDVSYKTAWYLCHRIRHAMDVADPQLLTGIVDVEQSFVGGKHKNRHSSKRARGHTGGHADKTMVIGAVGRDGGVRFQVDRRGPSSIVLSAFIAANVDDEEATVYTDTAGGYGKLKQMGFKHETVDHSADEWVRADVHTNTVESVWSLLKRSIVGSYHQLSTKHLESYLDEIAFRFNNRNNPFLFRDTLIAMLDAETLTYAELIGPSD